MKGENAMDKKYFYILKLRDEEGMESELNSYAFDTYEEAKEEADYCLDLLDGFYLDYPLVFDWETIDSAENPRTENISPETLTECAKTFCDTVNEAGYIPCLYTAKRLT